MSSSEEDGFASQTVRTRRRDQIATLLQQHGTLRVTALSQILGVSPMTVRRDLEELEAAGALQRVHGGAIQSSRADFVSRTIERTAEKLRIARAIAASVSDGETLLLDIGTTVFYVAQALRGRRDLTIVTNSINAALELADTPNRVILVGGMCTFGRSAVSRGRSPQ